MSRSNGTISGWHNSIRSWHHPRWHRRIGVHVLVEARRLALRDFRVSFDLPSIASKIIHRGFILFDRRLTGLVRIGRLFSVCLGGKKHCGQHQGSPQGSGSHGFLFRNRKATGWPSGRHRVDKSQNQDRVTRKFATRP